MTNFGAIGMNDIQGISAGPDGNLWFTNAGNNSIGRITPDGIVATYANPLIKNPTAIAAGPDGNLWFANVGNNRIGRITPAGVVNTYIGTGISTPTGITTGPDSNLWFTNKVNNSIGRITTSGIVTNYKGTGIYAPSGITTGADGNLWFTNPVNNSIGRITPTGVVSNYTGTGINAPNGITAGPGGDLWFTNPGNNSIGRITPVGEITNITGLDVSYPHAITTGPDGNLWFTNGGTASIGRINPDHTVTAFSGTGISKAFGIVVGPDGNLWFPNYNTTTIGRITPSGVVSSFTGLGVNFPYGIASGSDGNLWFTNQGNNSIGQITPAGIVSNFTGPGINYPEGIAAGPDGNLWFTNYYGNSIGRITTAGVVSNFTGPAISAPVGIAAGPDGNLWFTNTGGSIGRITPAGIVTDFMGTGIAGPSGIAAGPDGGMWFANARNSSIGRITAANVPDAPTGVTAVARDASAVVSWSPPVSDGGVPITGYTVTASPGGATCVWSTGPLSCTVTGLTNGAPYTFTVRATNAVGTGPPSSPSPPTTPATPGRFFHPLTPTRILDSRTSVGGWNSTPLVAGAPRALTVTGGSPSVPVDAAAVVLNLTATGSSANSFLAAYPADATQPTASNLNFAAGQTIANLVTVKVGTTGQVSFANAAGAVDVIADIAGYYDNVPGDRYNASDPSRVLDSRTNVGGWNTTPLTAATPRTLTVAGPSTPVPATATAVILNVTATGSTNDTYLTAYPSGASPPTVSNLNLAAGQTIANLTTIKIGTNGQIAFNTAAGSVDLIADIAGYYDPTTGDVFHPLTPTRTLDSRSPLGGWNGPLNSGTPRTLAATNNGGVPTTATAVIANTTATDSTANSFLTLYPAGASTPTVSNLNFAAGQTIANLTTVKLATNGQVAFAINAGATHVIFDVAGYFSPA